MRKTLPLIAALALPLAACATSPYGGYGQNPLGAILGSIGTLGTGYGQSGYGYGGGYGMSQAAAQACASYASRFGAVRITGVRQASSYDRLRVTGYVQRGYGMDNFGCTFRSDGRITDFDI